MATKAKAKSIEVDVLDADRPIAAYNPIRTAIAALEKKYSKTEFDVATTKGLDAAKAARVAIREPRYKVEHIRKALKAPALAYSKRIDTEAAAYTASLLAIETPIDDQIKAEEKRKEDERLDRERKEAERREAIDQAISDIAFLPVYATGKSAAEIQTVITELNDKALTEEIFGERIGEAGIARGAALTKLNGLHTAAVAHETEQARLAAEATAQAEQARIDAEKLANERKELDAERARQAEQQAELDRQKAELAESLATQATPAPSVAPAPFEQCDDVAVIVEPVPEPEPEVIAPVPATVAATAETPFMAIFASAEAQAAVWSPTLYDITTLVADHFDVDEDQAKQWIIDAVRNAA